MHESPLWQVALPAQQLDANEDGQLTTRIGESPAALNSYYPVARDNRVAIVELEAIRLFQAETGNAVWSVATTEPGGPSYGAIYRTIPLPPGVDGEKAQASFKNGVLTIKLPQTPEAQAKVRKIAVKEA